MKKAHHHLITSKHFQEKLFPPGAGGSLVIRDRGKVGQKIGGAMWLEFPRLQVHGPIVHIEEPRVGINVFMGEDECILVTGCEFSGM